MNIDFEKKTPRLILRPYTLDDYEEWRETHLNFGKSKNRWDQKPRQKSELTKAEFKAILKNHKQLRDNDKSYYLMAFDKKTGKVIGFASLFDVSRKVFQNAHLGYRIFHQYWGQGFGKELVSATLEVGFKNLKLHRIEAGIEPGNKRSLALAKTVGMRREGLSKKRIFLDKEWKDMVVFAMTTEEW